MRGERELCRLLCPRELRDDAEVNGEPRDLQRERFGLLDTEWAQPAIEPRIAVYDTVNVEDGLAMAREQQETHTISLAGVWSYFLRPSRP